MQNSDVQMSEREAFERFSRKAGYDIERDKRTGNYIAAHTHYMWEGWQASAALQRPVEINSATTTSIPGANDRPQASVDMGDASIRKDEGSRQPIAANLEHPSPRGHDSDCAVHNEPAMPNGECDCSLRSEISVVKKVRDLIAFDEEFTAALCPCQYAMADHIIELIRPYLRTTELFQRRNPSGCICKFADDGDTIISMCEAHKAACKNKPVSGNNDLRSVGLTDAKRQEEAEKPAKEYGVEVPGTAPNHQPDVSSLGGLTHYIMVVLNRIIPKQVPANRDDLEAAALSLASDLWKPKRESGEADAIIELFYEAQAAFDHGDDVTQMLRFGEATSRMFAYREKSRRGRDE